MSSTTQTIPARKGKATILHAGQKIKITNTHGSQVIDTWALALPSSTLSTTSSRVEAAVYPNATQDSPSQYSPATTKAASAPEYMSMCHTRAKLLKCVPAVNDVLISQKRAPMLKMVEDSSLGFHDTLVAACDRWRYAELGVKGYHGSCADNFWDALDELSSSSLEAENKDRLDAAITGLSGNLPDPFNLFMNIPIYEGEGAKRAISFEAPKTKAGDFVVLQAERDVVVVMSACPQDILTINGGTPKEGHFEVSE